MTTETTAAAAARGDVARPVAVIDVGSASIRMAVAEIGSGGQVRHLERLAQAVNLGKDTFTRGTIDKATTEHCVEVLKSYRRVLEQYQITRPEQIRVVATSAVREASNRLAFLDRIFIATGFDVEPLDEAEVSRITYLALQPLLSREPTLAAAGTMAVEVGGGSTDVLLLRGSDVLYSRMFRLGSLRLRQALETYDTSEGPGRQILQSRIRQTMEHLRGQIPEKGPVQLVALGGDVRFAAAQLGAAIGEDQLGEISVDQLEQLANRVLGLSVDDLVRTYHLAFPDAETLGPALLSYVELARTFGLEQIYVADVNLRDGLLREMVATESWTQEFRTQIVRAAVALGRKYQVDKKHAEHVAELCGLLFAALQHEHQLDSRFELLLQLAARLHEVGLFVGTRGYHKHSLYLISNAEMFGMSRNDHLLVGLIARYHRRASPSPSHQGFANLDRKRRGAVAKMAAILRIAKALDESRSQRIREFQCAQQDGRFEIVVSGVSDLSVEQLAIKESGGLFEEVFGQKVFLRRTAATGG
ncbi:MAG: exopolyphosphatase [Planctomycetota bacterium]|nr:MAG: exopolyphosphatase [Planctomycetota bacterium]REJ91515.1 MAG: exopolyphosphatase [Planctomycetota bacterium]REK27030.1 MAG: exopolyphosphatase [Planctomycetota bacterium]REK44386.1 MAG: exopolyphosphatase [Planctomycetota bacterium]